MVLLRMLFSPSPDTSTGLNWRAYALLNNANVSYSRMPTFIIFRSGKVLQTLRGADPRGLTSAVESAVRLAATMKQNYSYSSAGHTLGGPSAQPHRSLQQPWAWSWNIKGWFSAIVTFLGLYFVSLFSVSQIPVLTR
jgi:hypothetical protein